MDDCLLHAMQEKRWIAGQLAVAIATIVQCSPGQEAQICESNALIGVAEWTTDYLLKRYTTAAAE